MAGGKERSGMRWLGSGQTRVRQIKQLPGVGRGELPYITPYTLKVCVLTYNKRLHLKDIYKLGVSDIKCITIM